MRGTIFDTGRILFPMHRRLHPVLVGVILIAVVALFAWLALSASETPASAGRTVTGYRVVMAALVVLALGGPWALARLGQFKARKR